MIRVLVVDDDFMVARVHRTLVEKTPGFEVVGTASTGAEALAAVTSLKPDLVLLDIYLPDLTGIAVLQQLRANDATDVDVIVITAARDVETIKLAMRGGVVHYLVKPFDYATLRERLEHYGRQRRSLAELSAADQADVDRVFGSTGQRSSARVRMPKGIAVETAEVVRQALCSAGESGLSATECAGLTGLSRVSARRYLEHLVTAGKAEVRPRYGGAGRPERRYRWTGNP